MYANVISTLNMICLGIVFGVLLQHIADASPNLTMDIKAQRAELVYEINRVQDRCDEQDGKIVEKLEIIEALLSRKF